MSWLKQKKEAVIVTKMHYCQDLTSFRDITKKRGVEN